MAEKSARQKSDIVFLNTLFCLLVVFIHIASETVTEAPKSSALFKTVYTAQKLSCFVVPGFIMLSGAKLFINRADITSYPKYYFLRIKRIVIPYIFWSCVYYLYLCINKEADFDFYELLYGILNGRIWAHFYFVIVLIQFVALAPIWLRLFDKGNPAVHIAFSLIITIIVSMYLPAVLTYAFPDIPDVDFSNCFLCYQAYWTSGCIIGKHYKEFRNYLKSNVVMIVVGFFVCAAAEGYLSLITCAAEPDWMKLFHMLYAMSALLFFYLISQLFIGKAKALLLPVTFVNASSYTVYLMHCLVIVVVNRQLDTREIYDIADRFVYRTVFVYFVCIMFCIIWRAVLILLRRIFRRRK